MKNRYIFRARISERQFRRIVRLFALDLNAVRGDSCASALANVMQAIEQWIATAEEFGDSVPQPKSARLMHTSGERESVMTGAIAIN